MATLVLQVAGQALGASIAGSFGGMLGRAAGALAGYAVDRALFTADQVTEGPRLDDLSVQTSTEGSPIPRIYGRTRIAGQVIWATDYEEVVNEEEQGGKGGGATVRTYEYYANFAVALCEGPITRIGRIWADGKPLDQSLYTYRVYRGTETQEADALIAAKQETDDVPTYRGTVYVVFERMALEAFGNRIPQLTFEVARRLDQLEPMIRAVTVIPGSTEFGYLDRLVTRVDWDESTVADNRHTGSADTDWLASIDDLVATCPNLESVALVVAWFGNDLRCGDCAIMPGVEMRDRNTDGATWSVAGLGRESAHLVSWVDERPAFGGSPSDEAVVAAIADLKRRGLRVVLYPFIMMDVPKSNSLPDPYGGTQQATYPWRGRITCHAAPGETGTVDQTAVAAAQVAAFVGNAAPGDFFISGGGVHYTGAEWSYRRMILHYANLAVVAGGVDGFLIGSEMRGLTTVRSNASTYPFVDALVDLAADVKSVLGAGSKVTYAADWSEYFGHQPGDGSGDVYFHLDPLWASSGIDAVGIDNYMPLADWRDGDHADTAIAPSVYDLDYLRGNVAAGEGFDWYYASSSDRELGIRTAVTDGAYGKPWVFRYKDLKAWWGEPHYDRPGGVESATKTAWVPQSKPIWFTEIGCPAVDRGANQPNVFYDPKSSESFFPYFSSGVRDDFMQRRFLEAVLSYWDHDHEAFTAGANPLSSVYGGRMVDLDNTFLWTWDARPYPAFPTLTDVWSDGTNWQYGHWLTGRLGGLSLEALIKALLDYYDVSGADIGRIEGVIDGYVLDRPVSARAAIDPLAEAFRFTAVDTGTRMRFEGRVKATEAVIEDADIAVADKDAARISVTRAQETELPQEVRIGFLDSGRDYEHATAGTRHLLGSSARFSSTEMALVAPMATAQAATEVQLHDIWASRERFTFSISPERAEIEVGDLVELNAGGRDQAVLVERIEDAGLRRIEARSIDPDAFRPTGSSDDTRATRPVTVFGKPVAVFLDLPRLNDDDNARAPYLAVHARPWYGTAAVWRSETGDSFRLHDSVSRRAVIGETLTALQPGPVGVWDRRNTLSVRLYNAGFSSREEIRVLNGANAIAVETTDGGWEVLQFVNAELTASRTYTLSRLLRAQLGTEDAMAAGSAVGARVVLLNDALVNLSIRRSEIGLPLIYRVGPGRRNVADQAFREISFTAGGRGLRPYSPVHIRARRDAASGDLALSWIRRTRTDGDSWEGRDVPLGESEQLYQVEILDGGTIVRSVETDTPRATYSAAQQIADFGVLPSTITLRVAQLNDFGAGIPREVTLNV
ncbi:MAG: hypothetical protein C0606_00540 [Hyphomicrobiales bacterium]|nr:MAG: hypothetical protein C0606_00540 [Hyphomicrobiales bacterium]